VEESQKRRQRHLIDFDNPRPPATDKSFTQVQRWVVSILALVTIEHLAGGIALSAVFTDEKHVAARVGLNVMAAVAGVFAVVLFRAIHGMRLLSPWLLLGVLPGVIGAWLTFGR